MAVRPICVQAVNIASQLTMKCLLNSSSSCAEKVQKSITRCMTDITSDLNPTGCQLRLLTCLAFQENPGLTSIAYLKLVSLVAEVGMAASKTTYTPQCGKILGLSYGKMPSKSNKNRHLRKTVKREEEVWWLRMIA